MVKTKYSRKIMVVLDYKQEIKCPPPLNMPRKYATLQLTQGEFASESAHIPKLDTFLGKKGSVIKADWFLLSCMKS